MKSVELEPVRSLEPDYYITEPVKTLEPEPVKSLHNEVCGAGASEVSGARVSKDSGAGARASEVSGPGHFLQITVT